MAYNYGNYTPGVPTYNPYYPTAVSSYSGQQYNTQVPMQQPQVQSQQAPQQMNAGFVWVQGEAAAKAYPVAAGNSVLLMDSDAPVLYMKSTDVSGKPLPLEVYDLVKREPASMIPQQTSVQQIQQPQIDLSEYVKMSDLEAKVKEIVDRALEQ